MKELVLTSENTELLPDGHELSQTDFPTTVQVTLAKRILRPGSNKILCLAAQTSVPLHENELASVSDLGLKLSDGTNVRLSLSSFNDQRGGRPIERPEIPHDLVIERVIYDPARYEPNRFRAGSRTPVFMTCLCLIATTACLFVTGVLTKPLGQLQEAVTKTTRSRPAKSPPPRAVAPRSAAVPPAKQFSPQATAPQPSAKRQNGVRTERRSERKQKAVSSDNNTSRAKPASSGANGRSGSFFVPPPPPVVPLMQYGYPPTMPTYPGFGSTVAEPKAPTQPVAKTKAPSAVRTIVPDAPSQIPVQRLQGSAPSQIPTQRAQESAPVYYAQTPDLPKVQQRYEHKETRPHSEPVVAVPQTLPATTAGAPVPGNHNESYRMERIIWPEDRIH